MQKVTTALSKICAVFKTKELLITFSYLLSELAGDEGDPELAIAAGFVHSENPDVFANSLTQKPPTAATSSSCEPDQIHKSKYGTVDIFPEMIHLTAFQGLTQ